MNRFVSALVLAPALGALATGSVLAPAATAPAPDPSARPEAHGLMTPLSLAVTERGVVHVSQNFAGLLTRIGPGGKRKVVARADRGGEVGAVSVRRGVVTYAVSRGHNESGLVRQVRRNGTDRALADLGRYERRNNPDGDVAYGFTDLRRKCEAKLPEYVGPARYDGVVETHPYATTSIGDTVYVADAGANAVLAINRKGVVSTVAVLPPAVAKVTGKVARANGLPACTVGSRYRFEAVPTDVEVGPGGDLYVTSLPGGPEDGSVGRLGSVLRVDRLSGDTTRVVRGLLSATGLAVAGNGDLYVAELFGGRIVRVLAGASKPTTLRRVTMPGDLEIASGRLWATTEVLVGTEPGQRPGGKVRSFPLP
jgi:hypothetical protein